jgi:hypothetical protein
VKDGSGEVVMVGAELGEIVGAMVFVVVLVGTIVWVCDGMGVKIGTGVFDGWMGVPVGVGNGVGVRVEMIPSSSPTMKRVMDTRQQVLQRRQIIITGTIYWLL